MAHRVTGEAEADLDDIWVYVAMESGSMDVATRLIDSITDRFVLLASFPFAGRARSDDFGAGSRSFAAGEYVIVYCVEGKDVQILRVFTGNVTSIFLGADWNDDKVYSNASRTFPGIPLCLE